MLNLLWMLLKVHLGWKQKLIGWCRVHLDICFAYAVAYTRKRG